MTVIYRTDDGKEFDDLKDALYHERIIKQTKAYQVTLHFHGTYKTTVEASNEDEAIDFAREQCNYEDISFLDAGTSVKEIRQ